MRLLEFLRRERTEPWTSVIAMTVVAGIANGVLLALINTGASAAVSERQGTQTLLLYAIALTAFIASKNYALNATLQRVEQMVRALRVRICDEVRRADLPFIETLGRGQLYTTVAQDANLISQSAFLIANAVQAGVMLLFALFYIAFLSPLSFFIIIAAIAVGALVYEAHRRAMSRELKDLTAKDAEFLDAMGHVIDGFKETKLNRRKSDALFDSFREVASEAEGLKVSLGVKFATDVMFSHVFTYVLIGVIVFVLPRLVPTFSDIVLKVTAGVLFIVAPLEMIVSSMPVTARANVALDNLYTLEDKLAAHVDDAASAESAVRPFHDFSSIAVEHGVYRYGAEFGIGPIDLRIARGETVFIVGGNGSGKSTLLKVLTGLYPLSSGALLVDGKRLSPRNISGYRELIAAIFTDFHLFDRLYGLEDVPEEDVDRLLRRMELDEKTEFVDGRFTTVALSTGQRKRLALIGALLEDREIYVFDEWAADQDVHFRAHFYDTILAGLRAAGKTVIAVTHDDRYWGVADRILKMDAGRIVSESPGQSMRSAS
jgi:putative ATP-binding cassette transporter